MDDFEQIPFGASEFADNPEPRCPCLLLLDVSGSMSGEPIRELNEGLITFKNELLSDSLSSKRVEVGIVTFGPVKVATDFTTVDNFIPPRLSASGNTPMGEAIARGVEMIQQRKETYKENGISYYRPWIFLITDGAPTDKWKNAAALVREGEQSKSFLFFAVGVDGADFDVLSQISSARKPVGLKGLRFSDLFSWLSNSLGSVSSSRLGEEVPLVNPATPEGWASV